MRIVSTILSLAVCAHAINYNKLSSLSVSEMRQLTLEVSEDHRRLEALSNDCLDKMCVMLESFFTCEVFGIEWEKICAKYILGYLYSCPIYPSPSKITEAPSVCLQDILALKTGPPDVKDTATSPTRYEDCYIGCYQDYLNRAIDFFQTCGNDLNVTEYPILQKINGLEVYRDQACGFNQKNENRNESFCVDLLLGLIPGPTPTASPSSTTLAPTKAPTPDLLYDYTCIPSYTPYVGLCNAVFKPMGCCVANQLVILTSINQTYAPCTLDYITRYCQGTVSVTDFCYNGTQQALGVIQAYIKLNFTTGVSTIPLMDNYDSYIKFRAIATQVTLGLSPLQMVVYSYTFYNGVKSLEQSANGATSAEYRFQIMLSAATETEWSTILSNMTKPKYSGTIAGAYKAKMAKFTILGSEYYYADPIELKSSGASWNQIKMNHVYTTGIIGVMIAMVLFMQ